MTRYIVQRLMLLIFVLLGISVITFTMMHLVPGTPADVMLGEHATNEKVARFRKAYGLDDPIPIQYLRYLSKIARGDFGRSVRTNFLVTEELAQRLPATVELTLGAMFVACLIGIPAGILAAYHHNSFFDLITMIGSLIGVSMPVFWLGLVLSYIFGFRLRLLPPSARLTVGVELPTITEVYNLRAIFTGSFGSKIIALSDFLSNFYIFTALVTGNPEAFIDALKHLILPSLALGTIPMANIARMTRSSLLEVLGQDYIRTARAKGLSERVVILVHALKNAFLPIITVIGLLLGGLLGGAILTETIFSWPGMGRLIVDRVLARDYPAVQGGVMVTALLFVFINLLVDISYAYLDPRIRYE